MTVYLGGPMEGLTQKQMTEWRNYLTGVLESEKISVRDPCRRKKFHNQPYSINLANRITRMDLQDIDACDVMFANLSDPGHNGRGTVMEVMYAHMKGKIVITVMPKGYNHPFIDYCSTEVHTDFYEAMKSTINYYR